MTDSKENHASAQSPALARAMQFHLEGRTAVARSLYRAVIQAEPENSEAHNHLGILMFESGEVAEARRLLNRSIELAPGWPAPHNNLANILRTDGDLEGAIRHYTIAHELTDGDPEIASNLEKALAARRIAQSRMGEFRQAVALGEVDSRLCKDTVRSLYAQGLLKEATEVLQQWLRLEPENELARHTLAAMTGESVPERASEEYVRGTFDGFAESFDEALERLGYRVPELIVDCLQQHWPADKPILRLLDAGCGTGLCGPRLRPMVNELVGVDLSAGMLEKAAERGVYDQLIELDLIEYLNLHPRDHDVILAADTLVYFGDLEPVLRAAAGSLMQGGMFVFSVEAADSEAAPDHGLGASGRYFHEPSYVETVASDSGFSFWAGDKNIVRTERGHPVSGRLIVLTKR